MLLILPCLIKPSVTAFYQRHLTLKEHDKYIFLHRLAGCPPSFSLGFPRASPPLPFRLVQPSHHPPALASPLPSPRPFWE